MKGKRRQDECYEEEEQYCSPTETNYAVAQMRVLKALNCAAVNCGHLVMRSRISARPRLSTKPRMVRSERQIKMCKRKMIWRLTTHLLRACHSSRSAPPCSQPVEDIAGPASESPAVVACFFFPLPLLRLLMLALG